MGLNKTVAGKPGTLGVSTGGWWFGGCLSHFACAQKRSGVWEADLESWLLTQASGHQEEINKLVEPPQPIGFSGRSGRCRVSKKTN